MGYCLNVGECEERPSLDIDPAPMNTHNNCKKLWQWWQCWIIVKKGCLYRDTDKEELAMGCEISWMHLFWKLRAKLRKMIATTKPSQGFKYDAGSYALNFDDGCWQDLNEHCLACKYHANAVHPVVLEACKPASS